MNSLAIHSRRLARIATTTRARPLQNLTTPQPLFPSRRSYVAATMAASADRVHRVTLLKLPKAEDQKLILDQYRKLAVNNKKVTKPPWPPNLSVFQLLGQAS